MSDHKCCRLCAMSFGLALGLLWAIAVLLMGFIATFGGFWTTFVTGLGEFYFGYAATFVGSIIGAVWAFVDGFIGWFVFVWLYNMFRGCCAKRCKAE